MTPTVNPCIYESMTGDMRDAKGNRIGTLAEKHAAYIVRAVNSHQALVEAKIELEQRLRLALEYLAHPDVLAVTERMALSGSVVVQRIKDSLNALAQAGEGGQQ